jgi:hypothetical protein
MLNLLARKFEGDQEDGAVEVTDRRRPRMAWLSRDSAQA